jgi:hypothetical protein
MRAAAALPALPVFGVPTFFWWSLRGQFQLTACWLRLICSCAWNQPVFAWSCQQSSLCGYLTDKLFKFFSGGGTACAHLKYSFTFQRTVAVNRTPSQGCLGNRQ